MNRQGADDFIKKLDPDSEHIFPSKRQSYLVEDNGEDTTIIAENSYIAIHDALYDFLREHESFTDYSVAVKKSSFQETY